MNERVFHDPSCAGVYYILKRQAAPAALAARKAGLEVLEADVARFGDRKTVLEELGRAWNFPEWYGANFDALHDCLTDEDWISPPGRTLFVSGLDTLHAANPGDFQSLIDVFRSAAEIDLENGTPAWVLIDTAAPGIPPLADA